MVPEIGFLQMPKNFLVALAFWAPLQLAVVGMATGIALGKGEYLGFVRHFVTCFAFEFGKR